MRAKLIPASLLLWFSTAFALLALGDSRARAKDLKFEVQLIWGTNEKESPDPKHTPVEAEIRKKLDGLPLKWANYFVVNRKTFTVPPGGSARVPLSEKCELGVADLGHGKIELTHYGKGKEVWRGKPALPKGETFVLGGNAPNSTSWLIVLKRIE